MSRFHQKLNLRRWSRVRFAALSRAGFRCGKCKGGGRLEVHHKKHLQHGGAAFAPENLVVYCKACHFDAHAGKKITGQAEWELEISAQLARRWAISAPLRRHG